MFPFFCYTGNSVSSMPICANYSQNQLYANREMQFQADTSSLVCKRMEPMVCKNDDGQKRTFRKFILYRFAATQFQWYADLSFCCRTVVLVYNSKTSNKSISNGVRILGQSLDDVNLWYNTFGYQCNNEAINKQKRMDIHTHWPANQLAFQPACRPACLPTGPPAYLPTGTLADRQTFQQTNPSTEKLKYN